MACSWLPGTDWLPDVWSDLKASRRGAKIQEIEANAFAASLLMPKSMICEQLEQQPIDAFDDISVKQLAAQFGVSV